MKVTLKDIAEDTGYSISTISRVLNGSEKLSTKARHKIYQSAKKLNYPLYQTLSGEELIDTLNVALVLTQFDTGEFYASFFSGFNTAAQNKDIQLSLIILHSSFEDSLERLKKLCNMKIDGLIVFAPQYKQSDYKEIQDALPDDYPVVSAALIENPVLSTVTFDGYSGGYLAAEHFKNRGYKKCGIIRGAFEAIEARYRSNGFKDFIYQTNDMELIWDFDGDFSFESGRKAFKSFHKLEDKPRAIFASNDGMCHAFMEGALMHGYDIPGDIAIVGYDDLPICEHHYPSISSVHTNYQKLGEVTLEKLKEILSNPKQDKGVLSLVPVNLEVRESS
ncbi:MAG TPA: LacI family DNA-binding transcriptional regulator [Fodinibius sp.]|nr:LacI family DNA-binding transcriptional regulator [Fodinibius sp.]